MLGPNPSHPAIRIAVFLALFVLATLIHVTAGAFESGFGGFEDEPAHLVTALMIRDWLVSGEAFRDPGGARAFAETYYVHYPKVAVGQWPPVFHVCLGLWMTAVGTTTASVVIFLSLLATITAFAVFGVVRRPLGDAAGMAAGVLFLFTPIVQECSASAMTEILIALLGLLSVLAFGRFMDTGRARWSICFAVLSAATILTKGSGFALALVPPIAIVIAGRYDLLKRPSLWVGGILVGLLAGPWYAHFIETNQGSWSGGKSPSFDYVVYAATTFDDWLPALSGWLGLLLVPVGMLWGHRNGALHGRWHALIAWLPALVILHLVIPSSVEERHLAVLAPAWTIFAALGAGVLGRRIAPARLKAAAPTAAICIVLALLLATRDRVPSKHWTGWGRAARDLIARGAELPNRCLIASDPVGEGLFVAGTAFADEDRPGRHALRGSKVLCRADWSGHVYEALFDSAAEVDAHLTSLGVGVVILDESVRGSRHWYAHMDQLHDMVQADGQEWALLGRWDLVRDGESSPRQLSAWVRRDWSTLRETPLTFQEVRGEVAQRR